LHHRSVVARSEFVRWEFYASGEETPFLTADTQFVDMHWTQAKNTVARVVTRPKDEYKLRLETKVTPAGTPGDDCPGYIVVEDARTIGTLSYHGPRRYYPKDGWVRLRPVANPGYRFVKWDAKTTVRAAVLGPLGTRTEEDLKGLQKENVAVCMQGDTEITAVFEFAPNLHVEREKGALEYLSEDDPLLALAGFVPDVDELFRWRKTTAPPGEIFKLIITDPPRDRTLEYGVVWDWTFDGGHAHIKDIEEFDFTHSLDLGPAIYNVCYVEADNKYVTGPKPIGVIKISAAGSARVLMTIVVDYGEVKEYTLNVIKHERLAKSREDVEGWLKKATEEIFLWDSYPKDNQAPPQPKSIRERYVDQEDVNCPIALVLGRFEEFQDIRVKAAVPQSKYLRIDDQTELTDIKDTQWENPVWIGPNGEIDVRKFDVIMVKDIYNAGGYARHAGYGEDGQHIWMGTDHAAVVKILAHEFGHYAGDLDDTYICDPNDPHPSDPNQNGCGRTWLGCTCFCGNCNRVRQSCPCDPQVQRLPALVNDPACPNNFMGRRDEDAVLPAQRDKLR